MVWYLKEDKDGLRLELALPGLDVDDLSIDVEGDLIRVFSDGNEFTGLIDFQHYISPYTDVENIDAELDQGILSIKMPLNIPIKNITINS